MGIKYPGPDWYMKEEISGAGKNDFDFSGVPQGLPEFLGELKKKNIF